MGYRIVLLLAAFAVSVPWTARAGRLDLFEAEATEQTPPPKKHPQHGSCHDAEDDTSLLGDLLSGLVEGLVSGAEEEEGAGGDAWRRTAARVSANPDPGVVPRRWGDVTVPLFRLEAGYQKLQKGVTARDINAEAGFGPFAIHARGTRFEEEAPKDRMDLTQWHLLYRMSAGRGFEAGLGLGQGILSGNGTHRGLSVSTPLRIQPGDHWGLEFRPAWAKLGDAVTGDYDLKITLGWKGLTADAGYRWTVAGDRSLRGPRVGVGVRF